MATSTPTALHHVPPHLRIEGFLGPDLVARLLAYAAAKEAAFAPTLVGRSENRRIDQQIRAARQLRDIGPLRPELEARFLDVLQPSCAALGLEPVGLRQLELELVAHGDGAFYKRHIDTFTGRFDVSSDRVLTGVYYFHRAPKAFSGGELRLYPILGAEGTPHVDIAPDNDTLALFVSWVPHEVRPVSCPSGAFLDSRFAINCWYRRERKA